MRKILPVAFVILVIGSLSAFAYVLVSYDTISRELSKSNQSSTFQPISTNSSREASAVAVRATDPFKGRRDAPVTIIMVSSFGCPSCKQAAAVLDQILALYPDSVRIVWKDLPESLAESYRAAVAARCAQQQGRFWIYHDRLFSRQDILSNQALYTLWARELGLQEKVFKKCLDTFATKELVDANINDALTANVPAVPYFQINNEGAVGLQSLAFFQGAVDAALQSAPSTSP